MTNTINNRTTTLLAARLSPESAARLFKPSLIVTPADQAAPPAPDAWATDTVNTMDAAVLPGITPAAAAEPEPTPPAVSAAEPGPVALPPAATAGHLGSYTPGQEKTEI